jgi:hypothetical protein
MRDALYELDAARKEACEVLDRAASPQPVEQTAEPVAWFYYEEDEFIRMYDSEEKALAACEKFGGHWQAVYTKPVAQPVEQTAQSTDTGNAEADRIINRLSSSDPDFDDCVDAAAFIRKLVTEHKGPDGLATWKDAAIAERMHRIKVELAANRYMACRESAIERGLFATPEEYDAMVDDSLRKKGKEVLTGRGNNYGKRVARDGSLYRAQPVEQTRALTDDERDAARYRWLRNPESEWSALFADPVKFNGGGWVRLGSRWITHFLDKAIDVAMAGAQPASGDAA